MSAIWKKFNSPLFVYLFILIISTVVFLPNLNRHFLWQDESQTALLSRSILTNGIPFGHDDKNSFSQELGAENGSDGIYKWHPWIPFYIHAAFFYLFGQSDFVARLPDVLFGMGTILLCYWIVRFTGWGTRASLLSAGILMLMIPFLLLSRQCRYYSMAAFFSTGCILAYFLFLQSKKHARLLFVCSTVILFHIQMVYGALLLFTVLTSSGPRQKRSFQTHDWSFYLCFVFRPAMDMVHFRYIVPDTVWSVFRLYEFGFCKEILYRIHHSVGKLCCPGLFLDLLICHTCLAEEDHLYCLA